MNDRNLTEAQARALWERAASLQAQASAAEAAPSRLESGAGDGPREPGGEYSVEMVVQSAVEAGIPEEYVERALSELGDLERGRVDRWAESYTGDDTALLLARRTLQGAPQDVYAAMQRVLPNPPFGLTLAGTDGRPPLEGGTLRFEVPYSLTNLSAGHQAVMDLRHWADIKEIRIRLRGTDDDPPTTEVEIWALLANTRRVNFWTGTAIGSALGGVVGLVGGAVAFAVLDPVTATQVAGTLGAAGGAAVGTTSTSRWWWRPLYRLALRRGRRGMERILDALVVDLQTGGAFTRRDGGSKGGGGLEELLTGF